MWLYVCEVVFHCGWEQENIALQQRGLQEKDEIDRLSDTSEHIKRIFLILE